MNTYKYLLRVMIAPLAIALVALPVRGADAETLAQASKPATLGAVTGIIRTSAGVPLASATVTASMQNGTGIRATISGSDGIYSFADMVPGSYSVTSQADNYADRTMPPVLVTGGRATRLDIALDSASAPPVMISTAAPVAKPAVADAAAPKPASSNEMFLNRWVKELDRAYAAKAAKTSSAATTTPDSAKVASLGTPPIAALDRPAPDAPEPQVAAAPAAPAPAPNVLPDALSAPEPPPPGVDNITPFAFGDFTWLNGNPRTKDTVLDTKFFTPEVRFDVNYVDDFNQPKDHTMGGSTEEFRSSEIQIEQASVGGDFHWQNVRGRILFMNGLFATTTPRNDASSATGSYPGNTGGVGQWDLQNAYKYVSEAYGGYHFDKGHGINIDAGIFVSYIGLFSYYNFDNWTYQPSYVSSNTPWFFNGVRVQWFVTNKLKIEPWVINGWQSYAKYNSHPGLGGQILYMPKEWLKLVGNQYGFGEDNLGLTKTQRIHTDDSIELRYYSKPDSTGLSKAAFSFTGDAGCQYGGGITCHGGPNKSSFLGWMLYDRYWFHKDTYAITIGGGQMNNTGRYLTLLPPIDGATAATGSAYFTELPGQTAKMWDSTVTFHYMPKQYITWWGEIGYRSSNVPYFSGRGGITPPGGNNGAPQDFACTSGASAGTGDLAAAQAACGGAGNVWFPDLRKATSSIGFGLMVKF